MMLDLHDLPNRQTLSADVCIVGAGAAGITLALELIDGGLDVLVLEAGGRHAENATQALYTGFVSDERLHSPPDKYRQRRFGGTTTIWAGRSMPLDAIDFEARDYVPHSGWPITLDALQPFYPKANALCEVGAFAYTTDAAFGVPLQPMIAGFESRHFTTDQLERFSCPTDFGARYGHKLAKAVNVRVLLHANVTHLQLDPGGRTVVAAVARGLSGHAATINARRFILAPGGLETVRLLLASRDVQRNGIGNDHDVVGRYYMCHLAGTIGAIKFSLPFAAIAHGYDLSDEGVYCRRRLALMPTSQRQHGVGNFIARLHHPRITDPAHRNAILSLLFLAKFVIPYEYGKRLHGNESASVGTWLRHLVNVASGPLDAVGFAWHMLRDRKFTGRKFPSIIIRSKANLFSLDFHAEQEPNPASRVTLADMRDALGMPRLHIDWRYTSGDIDTVSRALELLAQDFHHSGVGTFDYQPDSVEKEIIRYGAYGGHHIGTTRMGTDPHTSVVNADGRIHSVDNLYISSSAIFPTSGQANPTLTIVAFALRLAAHLKTRPPPTDR